MSGIRQIRRSEIPKGILPEPTGKDYALAFLFITLIAAIVIVGILWACGVFGPVYVPPPTANEVCANRGGVRQATPGNGWGGGPSVVCMDGFQTSEVRVG